MKWPSKVYLAGFDVFREDAVEQGARLKAACARYGMVGLYPMDNAMPAHLNGPDLARWIFEANIALIRSADIVMANMNNFRGAEPDSGTVWETGFASAIGKPVWGYMERLVPLREQIQTDETGRDRQGYSVENFGLPRNLMIACSSRIIEGTAEDCLNGIARALRPRRWAGLTLAI